jgi:HPt (histidine-containing phosphotransfer) domain-containing protein
MTRPRKGPDAGGAPAPVIDRDDALERMEGDASLLEELLVLFREEFPARKAEIDRAAAAGDGEALRLAGHALKGSAANLSLMALRERAYQLEAAGKEGRVAEAPGLIDQLEFEYGRFESYLRSGGKPAGRAPAAGSRQTPRGEPQAGGKKRRILIVDDARDTRRLTKAWADEAGHLVDTAADGAEALGRVDSTAYDVIFLDLNLGRQRGTEVLSAIRALEKRAGRRPTRVIAFSAAAPSEVETQCRAAGFDDCLEKPVARMAFLSVLEAQGPGNKTDPAGTAIDLSLEDLIPAYLENRRNDLRVMTRALADGDWPAIAELGHKIKGSGTSYGFPEISDLGRELERAAGAEELEAVRAALAGLAARVQEASRGRRG